jgi:hypothetical protein
MPDLKLARHQISSRQSASPREDATRRLVSTALGSRILVVSYRFLFRQNLFPHGNVVPDGRAAKKFVDKFLAEEYFAVVHKLALADIDLPCRLRSGSRFISRLLEALTGLVSLFHLASPKTLSASLAGRNFRLNLLRPADLRRFLR